VVDQFGSKIHKVKKILKNWFAAVKGGKKLG
jgi:hypothetical protein